MDVKIVVVVAVVAIVCVVIFSGNDSETDNETFADYEQRIDFFFYDNYGLEVTVGLMSENKNLANGYWVRGFGETKIDCFNDACEKADIKAVLDDDRNILSLNGFSDENYYQMGWAGPAGWTKDITLSSEDGFDVRYMSIGHGRWIGEKGKEGTFPEPWQNPDDILWRYGESAAPGEGRAVKFYFYDNYSNEGYPDPGNTPMPSIISGFVADGYWVIGYGDSTKEAFEDACERVYGTTLVTFEPDGNLTRIGGIVNNLHVQSWDGSSWNKCRIPATSLSEDMAFAIGYGPSNKITGEPPEPWENPTEGRWCL